MLPGATSDAWIGDDVIRAAPPWLATALTALRDTAARIPVWLGRGNRDFLIGEELAQALGARLLPEPALLETDFGPILLTHGDEYCTDDAAYQQFRQMVRNPQWQAEFLAKTIPERLAMAQQARGESQAANQTKSMEIMDVNAGAVEQAFPRHGRAQSDPRPHAPPGLPRWPSTAGNANAGCCPTGTATTPTHRAAAGWSSTATAWSSTIWKRRMGGARQFLGKNLGAERAKPMRPWADSARHRPQKTVCPRPHGFRALCGSVLA